MGACISSHHKYSSTMKVHVSSRTPIKDKLPIINHHVALKPHSVSPDVEETFFDSQAWLDSDCESDFMSVNGEFTPSRGNTPLHHNFAPQMKGGAPGKPSVTLLQPPPSPLKKKKRLSELFSESQREGHACDDENGAVGSLEAVAVRGGGLKPKRGRWVEIVQAHGCIPKVQNYRQK
ncbi:hypothetical protein HanRHA438_Chr07g0315901 [Helianthus annuus]|nr:hypothetical protein HanHA300_Chr07g0252781 [Helianthus annuus]KAJ0557981.1 hypothetical protein HanIR_Chr07g0331271 [Helianthus annuus]KAJ0564015.1 hypothetical protein HanHA89_Chr07g0269541 [Helianthus annuus]KAJ0729351.1 hypothetical protein HanLR1_Chr07g0251931 [Helianthus annuus]KAJ0905698.1 hypothetical protein HanPSC8_Chr07g0296941 [Helianthus annuus]